MLTNGDRRIVPIDADDDNFRRGMKSPARFIRATLQGAASLLPSVQDIEARDDCRREIAVGACAAGFAGMAETFADFTGDPVQRFWATAEIAYVHAAVGRSRHAQQAIRRAETALKQLNEPVRCEIASLLGVACAKTSDARRFDEITHRVLEAIKETDDEADQIEALAELAVGSLALGDGERAAAWLAEAEAIAQSASDGSMEYCTEHLAMAYVTIGDDAGAIRAAESGHRFSKLVCSAVWRSRAPLGRPPQPNMDGALWPFAGPQVGKRTLVATMPLRMWQQPAHWPRITAQRVTQSPISKDLLPSANSWEISPTMPRRLRLLGPPLVGPTRPTCASKPSAF
jgi:hypothetical protein